MRIWLLFTFACLASCVPHEYASVNTSRSLDFPIGIKSKTTIQVITDADLERKFPTATQTRCKEALESTVSAKNWRMATTGVKPSHILLYQWKPGLSTSTGYQRIGDRVFEDKIYSQICTAYLMEFGSTETLWKGTYINASSEIDMESTAVKGAEAIGNVFPVE